MRYLINEINDKIRQHQDIFNESKIKAFKKNMVSDCLANTKYKIIFAMIFKNFSLFIEIHDEDNKKINNVQFLYKFHLL